MNVETLLPWGKPKECQTKHGPRILRKARPTDEFWEAWAANQGELRSAGVSLGKDQQTQAWECCWWQTLPEEVLKARADSLKMSRAVDTKVDIEIPAPEGLAYMPFQKVGIAYAVAHKGCLIGDEMGTGKTIQTLGLINVLDDIHNVLIVTKASLKENWRRECVKWLTRKMTVGIVEGKCWPTTDVKIINFDLLHKFPKSMSFYWDLVVVDECFPAGTMVNTPKGQKAIESIEEGDEVLNAIGVGTVVATSERTTSRLVEITLQTTERITCTPTHLFLTNKGWKYACDLSEKHYIKTHEQSMRVVRSPEAKPYEPFLREILFSEVEDAPAFGEGCDLQPEGESKTIRQPNQKMEGPSSAWEKSERAHDLEKSNANTSDPGTGVQHAQIDRSQTDNPRGKRDRTHEGGIGTDKMLAGSDVELCNTAVGENATGIPYMLQGGPSVAGSEDLLRSGRTFTLHTPTPGPRPKKGSCSKGIRVVSVKSIELTSTKGAKGSSPGIKVYNLQVSGHPSYSIGDSRLIVHNCQNIKGRKNIRTKALIGYKPTRKEAAAGMKPTSGINSRRRLALTGTPMENKPEEMWTTLHFLDPVAWPSFWGYAAKYCGMSNNGFGMSTAGASNLGQLQNVLRSTLMIRRLKKDVLTDLPPKTRMLVEIEVDGAREALEEEQDAWDRNEETLAKLQADLELAKASGTDAEFQAAVARFRSEATVPFTEITKVRHNTALKKLPKAIEIIHEEMADAREETKCIVFAHHRDVLQGLHQAFGTASVLVTGETAVPDRDAACQRFQKDPSCRFFVGSIRATGEGLNLQAASLVYFVEEDWNPAKLSQCEDRAHRIGQKGNVLVKHLLLPKSLDARMMGTIVDKQKILDQALDSEIVEVATTPAIFPKAPKNPTRSKLGEEGMLMTDAQRKAAHRGIQILAGVCDGAVKLDGVGLNKVDTHIGHSLAAQTWVSPRQASLCRAIAYRYRRQLGDDLLKEMGTP